MLAEIFEYFDEDDAGLYLDEMDVKKAADVVSELETDTAAKVLKELPKEKRELIVDAIDPEVRKQIRLIDSKEDDALEFAVVMGCLRISKESIFTGLNHLQISSIYNNGYEEAFGFTQKETEQRLVRQADKK